MLYKEYQDNLKTFADLIEHFSSQMDEKMNVLVKRAIEFNINILNDVFTLSIENLKKLENTKTPNDIICAQANFSRKVNYQLSLAINRFIDASLGNIEDYNEWLKAHCDLSTD